MNPDIKRQTELYIVDQLQLALPTRQILPFTGGTRTVGATEVEPPFIIIAITAAEKMMATEGTWLLSGQALVVTHHAEATSEEHSEFARETYAALGNVGNLISTVDLAFHGIDIQGISYGIDPDNTFHGDIIAFTAGVGG